MILEVGVFFLAGMVSSFIAGMFGLGGGTIVVPVMMMMLSFNKIAGVSYMHVAAGTSLAVMVVTGLAAVRAQQKMERIKWPVFFRLLPGIILGVMMGVFCASLLQGAMLRHLFALFLLLVAGRMLMLVKPKPGRELPNIVNLNLFALAVGTKSGLLGIGGGMLTVPFLLRHNFSMRQATGLSAACTIVIAGCGSLGFLIAGWGETSSLTYSSGYLYWPGFLGISLASIIFAPLGVRVSQHLPLKLAKRLFALLLLIIGLRMLLM